MNEDAEQEANSTELHDVTTVVDNIAKGGITPLQFEDLPIPTKSSPHMIVSWTIDYTQTASAKIVFHFKNIAISDMGIASEFLHKYVQEVGSETSSAEGSVSPIFRNQWDFMFFKVPSMLAPNIQKDIVRKLLDLFGEQVQ